jgi:hypothetical protein
MADNVTPFRRRRLVDGPIRRVGEEEDRPLSDWMMVIGMMAASLERDAEAFEQVMSKQNLGQIKKQFAKLESCMGRVRRRLDLTEATDD